MTISPRLAFDVSWEIYQSLRCDQEGISIIDPGKVASDNVWRPQSGPRGNEYVADFQLACQRALEGPENASCWLLCRLHYIQMTPYEEARALLKLREDVWTFWTDDIRDKVGRMLMQRGLFPARQYFGERSRPRRKKNERLESGGSERDIVLSSQG